MVLQIEWSYWRGRHLDASLCSTMLQTRCMLLLKHPILSKVIGKKGLGQGHRIGILWIVERRRKLGSQLLMSLTSTQTFFCRGSDDTEAESMPLGDANRSKPQLSFRQLQRFITPHQPTTLIFNFTSSTDSHNHKQLPFPSVSKPKNQAN